MRIISVVLCISFYVSSPYFFSIAQASEVNVNGTRIWNVPDNTRLVFDVSGEFSHNIFTLKNPDRIVIDMSSAALMSSLDNIKLHDFKIKAIRSGKRNGKDLRIVLDMKQGVKFSSYVLKPSENRGHRLVIDLYELNMKPASIADTTKVTSTRRIVSTNEPINTLEAANTAEATHTIEDIYIPEATNIPVVSDTGNQSMKEKPPVNNQRFIDTSRDKRSKWQVGLYFGASNADARMTGGRYSGNYWDLATNTVSAQVSGIMTDDKSDFSKRFSIYRSFGKSILEFYYADFGEFKSRSANLGITGGGNFLTGTASRSAYALGLGFGRNIFYESSAWSITPMIGLALVNVRDKIHSNLDFNGVGGSARGPVVKTNNTVASTAGLILGYDITDILETQLKYDYFANIGSNSTLGNGAVNTLSLGVVTRF